jgi:hypothetical protein
MMHQPKRIPHNAKILESAVLALDNGKWFAGVRFTSDGMGGYDCPTNVDMFRTDFDDEQAAQSWLDDKLTNRAPEA